MKVTKVGSSYLDSQPITTTTTTSSKHKKSQHNVYKYAQDRKPIITPILKSFTSSKSNHNGEGEQYLLIPNKDHILVLSMEHGHTVCKLIPYYDEERNDDENRRSNRTIETVTIVRQKKGLIGSNRSYYDDDDDDDDNNNDDDGEIWVVIAGFSDGMLQEWPLTSVSLQSSKSNIILPRRKFRFNNEMFKDVKISHITSPVGGEDGILFVLVQSKSISEKMESHLVRVNIPSYTRNDKEVEEEVDDDDDKEEEEEEDLIILNETIVLAIFGKNSALHGEVNEQDKVHEVNNQVEKFSVPTLPFALMSVSCERNGTLVTYITVVDKHGFTVYYENNFSIQSNRNTARFVRFSSHTDQGHIICAAAMSPNSDDIALGYVDGKIDIFVSVLNQTSSYIDNLSSTKEHPQYNTIKRTIHWHSLPVKTLCYLGLSGSRAAPNLLSGGEEAVLVTWNIERGLHRPSYTLPRISKGCITHIATNMFALSNSSSSNGMDIIVRCMDNTLQLIQGHNHSIKWKIQGLACSNNECVDAVSSTKNKPSVLLQVDPRTQSPLLTRMSGAPGFIHWYDFASNQVVGELEVAPYNRISRKEAHHSAYPKPTVTHFVISNNGNDLITVDTMLTENRSIGKGCKVKSFVTTGDDLSEKMSLVTNIKFWAWSRDTGSKASRDQFNKAMPYELISAMPNPHGVTNEIDGLAISPSGSKACSLSHEEGAFHIWIKGRTTNTEHNALTPYSPSWKRMCKITVPSGYSTAKESEVVQDKDSTVTFSNDGSVLAIAFGCNITLWDHSNATLLNTIRAPDILRHLKFVRSPLDMILAVGKSSVSIVAPFGEGYLGNDCWSYTLSKDTILENKRIELGLVTPLLSRKELAVSLKEIEKKGNALKCSTKVVLIDIMTGKPKTRKDDSICSWNVEGNVLCLCDISSQMDADSMPEEALLLVLTDSNDLVILGVNDSDTASSIVQLSDRGCFSRSQNGISTALSSSDAPKLHIGKKRKSDMFELSDVQSFKRHELSTIGKGSLVFNSSESSSLSTSQLPALTCSFTQSFLSQKFKTHNQSALDS